MRSPVWRDHVAAAIIEAAAGILAERGEAVSMAEIAAAAGVSRTTLWRYFPNRDELLRALGEAAYAEFIGKLTQAGLEGVDVAEGIARFTRVALGAGSKYRAVAHAGRGPEASDEALMPLEQPLADLLRRGAEDGTLRTDLSVGTLLILYGGLLDGAVRNGLHERLGPRRAAAVITSAFIDGAAGPAHRLVRERRPHP